MQVNMNARIIAARRKLGLEWALILKQGEPQPTSMMKGTFWLTMTEKVR